MTSLDVADDEVTTVARRIAELGDHQRAHVYGMSWWSDRMLSWAMANPAFKTQLFRFVDVFPATTGDADILRHIHEYFSGADAPRLLGVGLGVADHLPLGEHLSATVARRNIARMAHQFIVGESPQAAVDGLHRLWRDGSAFTVDLLGEKTVTEPEADRYAARVHELLDALLHASQGWAPDDHLERDDLGPLPRVSISIKPTALASAYAPLTRERGLAQAERRLVPILRQARDGGASVWFDMEHFDAKDLTLELFRRLLDHPEFASLHAGVVLQAYTRDVEQDLDTLLAWAGSRRGTPVGVRLVKGAYWDAETIHAQAEGWPSPLWTEKAETDVSYERCTVRLLEAHGQIRAAFASHNLRSLAYAITAARHMGIPDSGYEIQMLYGMAEPIHAAIRRLGLRLRVYCPVGELVPGMAYLVRRLLENTSNESFVRARFAEHRDLDALIAAPRPTPAAAPAEQAAPDVYRHEPPAEWRREPIRRRFAAAVEEVMNRPMPEQVPARIDGEAFMTGGELSSVDPAQPERVVARTASCTAAEADAAVAAVRQAWPAWARQPAVERAAVLRRTAAWLRERRLALAALEVLEAGKPWAEADADVCEAIDFCEYYAREMLRLAAGGPVESPPGEANRLEYQAKGVGVVIAPWNFPLAIPTGMVVAALVAGNGVVFKPAEQTPLVAARLVEGLLASGLPPGVLAFVPGLGEDVGAALVRHPDVSFVAFTGSRAVGLDIVASAAQAQPGQRGIKRVVAEMGGKNAIVVDADADLDQVVPAVVASAFGYAGQKCSAASRLVVVEDVHDDLVRRVVGAARQLEVGSPAAMGTEMGPLIDADAQARVVRYVASGAQAGRVVLARQDVPATGYFAGPAIIDEVDPSSPLAVDEIFGPVLAVFAAPTFEAALEVANATDYALTAGVFSRSPDHIRLAAETMRAGNVYVNRGITGAVVGRQPFGGYGLSGVGSKAGGPDYLLQFLDPRVVTENTMRQGFAPSS